MQTRTLEFRWTVSRGRDSYGYNICTLYVDGERVSACNGGGYDMKGTALGNWLAHAYADRLVKLRKGSMPEHSHWSRAENPRRICSVACQTSEANPALKMYPHDAETCPDCGVETRIDHRDGTTVQDGRFFYGLTFHDPDYNPGKARIGKDCADRTLGKVAKGKTVEQAEKDGESMGLERYQAFYSASSKTPTKRHRIPSIDGACGMSSVETIAKAIGLSVAWVPTRAKRQELYHLHDRRAVSATR